MFRKIGCITLAMLSTGLGGLFVLFLAIVAEPRTFTVRGSSTINAPPSVVFALINDLNAWPTWLPWKDIDAHVRTTVSTASSGRGATLTWDSNSEIGQGHATIVRSVTDELIEIDEVFVRPFGGTARIVFTLVAEAGGTRVTWEMDGTKDVVGQAIGLVSDLDSLLADDFDQAMAGLKTHAERMVQEP